MQNTLIVPSEIFLKDQFFEKGDGNWVSIIPTVTKQKTKEHIQPINYHQFKLLSEKKNEGFAYAKLLDKRNEIKLKYKTHNLIITADIERSLKKIQLVGDKTHIKLQKVLLIQYRVIALTTYQKDEMKIY